MRMAANRMKELINDLLSYSQLQKQNLSFEEVDLDAVVIDAFNEVDLIIREKSAVVEKDTLSVVIGNPIRLRQLFVNLISNALKYSKKDVPPHIIVRNSVNNGTVTITVRDNGIGFEEVHSERIFGLFERLHTRDKFPGTGIGLSICRKITDLHGGSIKATSVPGEFSEFEVTLPIFQNLKPANDE
jgi:signal transduction histidine kinase